MPISREQCSEINVGDVIMEDKSNELFTFLSFKRETVDDECYKTFVVLKMKSKTDFVTIDRRDFLEGFTLQK